MHNPEVCVLHLYFMPVCSIQYFGSGLDPDQGRSKLFQTKEKNEETCLKRPFLAGGI